MTRGKFVLKAEKIVQDNPLWEQQHFLAQGWQNNSKPNGKKYIELNYVLPNYSQLCHSQHCKINIAIIKGGTIKKDR